MLATTIQITNNPPHTTHTSKPGWLRGQPPQQSGRRSHGVEREPDSVLVRSKTFYAQPNKRAPTPTTHTRAVNTCRHKKTMLAPATQANARLLPKKWAP